jgi:Rad3-related DNA helicase
MALLSMIRIFHGNLINFFASALAIKWYLKYLTTKKEPGWIQTEHQYPTEKDLQLFRRKLGDLLLENRLVTSGQLEEALDVQKKTGARLGEILIQKGFLKEQDLTDILGIQQEGRKSPSS